jgi:hypothetical protein
MLIPVPEARLEDVDRYSVLVLSVNDLLGSGGYRLEGHGV